MLVRQPLTRHLAAMVATVFLVVVAEVQFKTVALTLDSPVELMAAVLVAQIQPQVPQAALV